MIGSRLKDLQTTNPTKEPNAYLTWIDNYVADDYTQAVRTGRGMIDVGVSTWWFRWRLEADTLL
jgi:hydroxymethylpyrimidine/phosphomethylpyrimidine kinase